MASLIRVIVTSVTPASARPPTGNRRSAEAPNGHLLVSNSDVINPDSNQPSEIVEFTKQGHFIKQLSVNPAQGGSFGLAVNVGRHDEGTAFFAAVDDNTATLTIWNILLEE